jgi:hypothetical protein
MFTIGFVSIIISSIFDILFVARLDTCHKETMDMLGIDGRLLCGFSIKQAARVKKFIYKREFIGLNDEVLNLIVYFNVTFSAISAVCMIGFMVKCIILNNHIAQP